MGHVNVTKRQLRRHGLICNKETVAEGLAYVTKRQLRRHGLNSVSNDSIEHRNLLAVHHINKKPGWSTVLAALKSSGNCPCPACSLSAKFGTKHHRNFEKKDLAERHDVERSKNPKKRLTVNLRNFMKTFKFTANTNRIYTPCHITPRSAVKNDTCRTFETDNFRKSTISCGKCTIPDSDVMPLTCHNMQGART